MALLDRIRDRSARVAVLGLGYVGIPLSLRAVAAGFSVRGIDVDEERIGALRSGASPILDVSSDDVAGALGSGRFTPTSESEALRDAEVVAICVPTPLRDDLPDLSCLEAAAKDVARNLRPGVLVVLESTTYPGTTEELLREVLETSGLRAGPDFALGFSPERIDPGNARFGLGNVPKIVGGIDARSTALMRAFYECFVERVVSVSSPRVAEMAKLLENTYRHVNIALANEMAILCRDLGIDVWEVIDAAATKPFGFHPFYPGPGWGGHCVPVDPAYLSWRVRRMGETARFVELARELNARMPGYVVQRVAEVLNEDGRSLKGARVLLLGVSYKRDVGDVRQSPALEILTRLGKAGAEVGFHDPYVEALDLPGGRMARSRLDAEALAGADLVLVVTDHSSYDWGYIASTARRIFDTRNALAGRDGPIVRL
ncbi:MAG: nucleotide sugar dehydrogenase [Actinomycetota bacterium]